MAMPETLVQIRHGLSEPNIVQRLEKYIAEGSLVVGTDPSEYELHDPNIAAFVDQYIGVLALKDEIYARPDHLQRLSAEGAEQARAAGKWLSDNFIAPGDYDEYYVSPFNRTIDTAIVVGGTACQWLADWRLVERDWGIYGATPRDERPDRFPHTERLKEQASFYVRYDNGESILDKALMIRDWVNTLDRDDGDKKVLAVVHGETMWATRIVIERILPQEYHGLEGDKTLRIGNCCIMIYTRRNPEDPDEKARSLSGGWLRMVDPVEPDKSPYGGEWIKLPGKRHFDYDQLQKLVEDTPHLIQ